MNRIQSVNELPDLWQEERKAGMMQRDKETERMIIQLIMVECDMIIHWRLIAKRTKFISFTLERINDESAYSTI